MASRSDIKAGSAFVELSLKDSAFVKGLRNAGNQLRDFGKGIATMGAAMAAAGATLLGPIVAGLKKFTESGEELYEMSQRTGVSAKALAQLGYAAKQSGTDMGQLEGGLRKMQRFLGEAATGSTEARTELARLGLTLADLQGLSPDQQFEAIGAKLAAINDPTTKAAAAMKIFGKSGTELIPLLNNLDAIAEAQRLGIGPSQEEVRLAHELSVNFGKLSGAAGAVVKSLGAAIAPMVSGIIPAITNIVVSVKSWIKQNSDLIQKVAAVGVVLVGAGTAIAAIGGAFAIAGTVLTKLIVPLQMVGSLFGIITSIVGALATPFGIIAGLLGAGAYLWARYTDSGQAAVKGISTVLGQLGDAFSRTFGGIKDALAGGDLALAGSIAMAGLRVAMLTGFSALASAVGGEAGNFIGALAAKLGSGDLSGAWSLAVDGMAAAWSSFTTFIKNVWNHVVAEIQTGIAFVVKQIKLALINAQALGEKVGSLNPFGGRKYTQEIRLNPETGRFEERGPGVDRDKARAEAEKEYQDAVKRADAAANKADDANLKFHAQQVAPFHSQIAGGIGANNDALQKAQDDLDRLRRQASDEAKAAADKFKDKNAAAGEGIEGGALKAGIFGTFSAAALAAGGGGQGPVVGKLTDIHNELKKNNELQRRNAAENIAAFSE